MRLQLAIDAAEHLALVPRLAPWFDVLEVGTPLLKRFGLSAISTLLELGGGKPVLADTKTVDGGALEAAMVFEAGASMMTVLSSAGRATRQKALDIAARHGGDVIFDTILEADPSLFELDHAPSATGRWLALHSSFDTRGTADDDGAHIARVRACRERGYTISLAGGIGPHAFAAVVRAAPDIAVIGSSVTAATDPEGVARWLRQQTDSARG